ncbi:hypothetical protein TRFO_10007 [Tritrichomonas foetus]|uniref:Surface antigen BspA-like n=1 Tax=Tritrichomonas foetus TaxID=1144522 RepID=A0A1J4JAZ0_9EUKA|nr:hypothetical protein TRFO_10007 [Tritrichomonas foetus]|eukprot:OHS96354.1 hypothetical protein TRFO_10007 [Tritrichomonas foetus]
MLFLLPLMINSLNFTVNHYNYNVIENTKNVVLIKGICSTNEDDLIIPSEVSYDSVTYTVTVIGESSFYMCNGYTGSLKLPDKLEIIENFAFQYCYGFTGDLKLPNTLEYIGNYSFFNCRAFSGHLEIPEKVIFIGNDAFSGCGGFTSLSFPDNLKVIGDSAFAGCFNIEGEIKLPISLESLGFLAFAGCLKINGNLYLPDKLNNIKYGAFAWCTALNGELNLSCSLNEIESFAFYSDKLLTSINIPEKVDKIGEYSFATCTGVKSLTFCGEASPEIEENAFNGLSLTSISVTSKYNGTKFIDLPVNIVSDDHCVSCNAEDDDFDKLTYKSSLETIPLLINSQTSSNDDFINQETFISIDNSDASINDKELDDVNDGKKKLKPGEIAGITIAAIIGVVVIIIVIVIILFKKKKNHQSSSEEIVF